MKQKKIVKGRKPSHVLSYKDGNQYVRYGAAWENKDGTLNINNGSGRTDQLIPFDQVDHGEGHQQKDGQPDYVLAYKEGDEYYQYGAAWKNDDGSLYINDGSDKAIYATPTELIQQRMEAKKQKVDSSQAQGEKPQKYHHQSKPSHAHSPSL